MFKAKQHPYRQWQFMNGKIFVKSVAPNIREPFNLPRQKLPNFFFQTGEIETMKRLTIIRGSVSGKKILPLFVKRQSIDIDDVSDLKRK
jgi:N-acylneuraminate cytidylyltransferase